MLAITTFALSGGILAQEITVQMNAVNDTGYAQPLGVVVISKTAHGLEFTPALSGLTPGEHGFHVHEYSSCDPAADENGKLVAAMAAGGHYDPEANNQHGSALNDEGHRGDLPVLVVDATGHANTAVNSVRLGIEDLPNRTLMLHAGGDNHSDIPVPMGGGGVRVACGLINP